MLAELLYSVLLAAGFLTLLILKSCRFRNRIQEPKIPVKRRPAPSKELITAMAQRRVYSLMDAVQSSDQSSVDQCGSGGGGDNDDDDEDQRWAREFIAGTCAKLDTVQPEVLALETIVSEFCDKLEKILDVEQARLCECRAGLSAITEARLLLEEEVFRSGSGAGSDGDDDDDDCADTVLADEADDGRQTSKIVERFLDVSDDDDDDDDDGTAGGQYGEHDDRALFAVYDRLVDDMERATTAVYVDKRDAVCPAASSADDDKRADDEDDDSVDAVDATTGNA